MVKSLKRDLFDFINNDSLRCNSVCKIMGDPNNNPDIRPHLERTDPEIGTSESRKQPLDNVNLVFTSNRGEDYSITLHEVIGRLVEAITASDNVVLELGLHSIVDTIRCLPCNR